jgi:uncharacterized metal-binding protein
VTGLKKKIGLTLKQESLAANKSKMNLSDIKLYAMNAGTLGVTTFTQIEDSLKILLLVITIGYTVSKWIHIKRDND